ncbi:MAG: Flp pilus assembly protein CpaB [Novosphingobium sp.]
MQSRNWIMIGLAVALGLFAVFITNSYFSGMNQRQEKIARQQQLVRIVVASQPLDFGAMLGTQNVRLQDWPDASVPEGAFRSIGDALKDNRVVLRPMVPGEPVLASKVSGTDGRATLASLLPNGMRAVSVPVGPTTGVSGFVLPGTMVDVLLTRKIPGDGALAEDMRSDVVLENVQVLAVDQLADDKKGDPLVAKTATLAVSLYDAQRLAVADKIGTLSLALRKVEGPTPGADKLADAGPTTTMVTNRELGGPRYLIGNRPGQNQGGALSNAIAQFRTPRAFTRHYAVAKGGPAASMTVVRGTVPMEYPVGRFVGGVR